MFKRAILFLLLLSLPLYFFTSHHWSFNDADESFYAQTAREMVQNGDWLTLHYMGTPCFHKTPLVFWLVAFSYKIFGINEFSARLPIILLAIISIFLIYFLARELFHDFHTSLFSSIILLTTYHFIYLGHMVMLDVPAVFFILLGLYGLLRSAVKKEWAILYGVSLGLAILSKGVLGLALIICIIPYVIWQKKFSLLRNFYLWIGIVGGIALCGSWYFYQIKTHGDIFLKIHFGEQVFQRSATQFYETGGLGIFFYPVQILANFFPWSIILPFSLFANVKDSFKKSEGNSLIISWVITFLVIVTMMRTKLPHYALLFYPFLALSVGRFVSQVCTEGKFSRSLKAINWIYIIFSIAVFIIAIMAMTKPEYYIYRKYVPIALIAGVFFLLLGVFYSFVSGKNHIPEKNKVWMLLLAGGTYIILVVSILGLEIWDFNPDIKKLAELNTSREVYCVVPADRPDVIYPARFYFGNSLVANTDESGIKKVWDSENPAVVLLRKNTLHEETFKSYKTLATSGEWLLIRK